MAQREIRRDVPLGGIERKTSRFLAGLLTDSLSESRAFTQLINVPQTEKEMVRVLGMESWGQVERAFEELGETPGAQETIMFIHDGLTAVSQRPVEVGKMMKIKASTPHEFIERLRIMCILNHPDLTRIYSYPPLTPDKFHRGYDPLVGAEKHKALEKDNPSERIKLCDEFAVQGRFLEILPLTRLLIDNREGEGEHTNKVVSERAARAIEHIGWSMHGNLESLMDNEVESLVGSIGNTNPVVRRHLTYALGYFPISKQNGQQVKSALERTLQDRDSEVQEAAKRALEIRSGK